MDPRREGPGERAPEAAVEGEAERFELSRDGPELAYEHLHRYVVAAGVLRGLRVLDLASGSGYGSRILARHSDVVALDLHRQGFDPEARGVQGDATRLPFRDGCFDAVVCFEAIEHVRDPEALVHEAERVLAGPGLFLVSTPDREIYSERAGHRNPFHVAEMDRRELESLLRECFRTVTLWGQSLWAGSWMARLPRGGEARGLGRRHLTALADPTPPETRSAAPFADPRRDDLPVPVYLFAACTSRERGRELLKGLPDESLLHDRSQWFLGQWSRAIRAWSRTDSELLAQLEEARAQAEDSKAQLLRAREGADAQEREIEKLRRDASALRAETLERTRALEAAAEAAQRWEQELEAARRGSADAQEQLAQARSAIGALEDELAEARRRADAQAREIAEARTAFATLEEELQQAGHGIRALEQELEDARESARAQEDAFARQAEEIARARENAGLQETELREARRRAEQQEAELAAAREASRSLEAEIAAAREAAEARTAEIETARRNADRQAAELAEARRCATLQEEEIARARELAGQQAEELERHREAVTRLEEELERARHASADAERQIERARAAGEAFEQERAAQARALEALRARLRATEAEAEREAAHRRELEERRARPLVRTADRLADRLEAARSRVFPRPPDDPEGSG